MNVQFLSVVGFRTSDFDSERTGSSPVGTTNMGNRPTGGNVGRGECRVACLKIPEGEEPKVKTFKSVQKLLRDQDELQIRGFESHCFPKLIFNYIMKVKVIAEGIEFAIYVDYLGMSTIIHDSKKYNVNELHYDDDNDEYIMYASYAGKILTPNQIEKLWDVYKTEGVLHAVKYLKENTDWGLKECKDYVDNHLK